MSFRFNDYLTLIPVRADMVRPCPRCHSKPPTYGENGDVFCSVQYVGWSYVLCQECGKIYDR